MLPHQSNAKSRYNRRPISEKSEQTIERTLQGRNMSGEMTLGTTTHPQSTDYDKDRRRKTMSHNDTQSRSDTHTGWSDDELFVATMESAAFLLFDAEIDEALDALITRWAPQAAPNAQLLRRSFKFPSAKPVNKPR
jgi:hypothetical protein